MTDNADALTLTRQHLERARTEADNADEWLPAGELYATARQAIRATQLDIADALDALEQLDDDDPEPEPPGRDIGDAADEAYERAGDR